jgi:flagellar biosynthetic protein FlhB
VQRSFLSTEALYNFFKNFGKVLVIGTISFIVIRSRIERLANLIHLPFRQSFSYVSGLVFLLLLSTAIVLLFLSLFDYLFQRNQHREQLKMTKQEVKEERKQYEGDPQIRSRLRQRMQELMSRNLVQNVQTADVVVTNPTHFAVALAYDADRMNAPTVTAKGQDQIAHRMRTIADESDVPIIENKPLARALFAEVEIGEEVPERFYEAIAIVLREVYRMTGKRVVYG